MAEEMKMALKQEHALAAIKPMLLQDLTLYWEDCEEAEEDVARTYIQENGIQTFLEEGMELDIEEDYDVMAHYTDLLKEYLPRWWRERT
jgi:hypothetical protein